MWKPQILSDLLKKRSLKRFYKPLVSEGNLCFDIGANRGERTEIFLELGAKVIAVEPQKKCFNHLVNRFGFHPMATLIHAAVGRQNGFAELNLCSESDECASLDPGFINFYSEISGFHWPKKEKVEMVTLDSLIDSFGIPDLCKIDVEGYEPEVFEGLRHTIPQIHFEFNQPLINDTLCCLERLEKLGKYYCNFLQYEKMNAILENDIPISDFIKNLTNLISGQIETGEVLVSLKKY